MSMQKRSDMEMMVYHNERTGGNFEYTKREGVGILAHNGDGRMDISYDFWDFAGSFPQNGGNFWVHETDYNSYAIVYGCEEVFLGIYHTEAVWIYTRAVQSPGDSLAGLLLNKVSNMGYDTSKLINSPHDSACLY